MRTHHLSLISAAVLLLSVVAHGQSPNPTDPPPGQKAILAVAGKGVQIYACQQTGNTPQWVFQSPDASLFDASGSKVGVHGAGPSWRYYDGSAIKGEVVAKSPSPEPTAVPWLLLRAGDQGESGILSAAQFIRRSDTHGGNAPATGCDAQHLNAVSRVPYTATYTFYSSSTAIPQSSEEHQH